MYLNGGTTYYDGTQQRAKRGSFLILASPWPNPDRLLYGCVRIVALQQVGQFMMGSARIQGHTLTLSGTYGNDGLPLDWDKLPYPVRAAFRRVPQDVAELYWTDTAGHNSSGNERDAMQTWGKTIDHTDEGRRKA